MKITHFLAGAVSGAVVAVLFLHESMPLQSIPTALSEAVSDLTSELPLNKSETDPSSEAAAPINRPTEIPLRRPAAVMMPYGKVTISAGTRVLAMRETATGVIAKFGGREVVIPLASFRPPASPVEPPPKGRAPSAQPVIVQSPAGVTAPGAVADSNPASQTGIASFAKSLLVVDGDESKGTASVISIRGQPLIVTNAHVLSGNKKVTFRRLNSKELRFGKLGISKDYDLAVATQEVLTTGLPMLEDVENNVAVGDAVVVLGNSLGSDVVTEIPGKVTGIGPDLIEVDAKFVHGNSGSPIVHVKTGKVLAVATFVTMRKLSSLDKDSTFDEIRRFGYRLDTAGSWEYPGWERFASEAATLKRIRRVTDQLVSVAVDIYDDGYLRLEPHQSADNPVRAYVTEYLRATKGSAVSQADILAAKQKLFRSLVYVTKRDLAGFDLTSFTGWHRSRGKEEVANRDFLLEKFTELASQQDAEAKIRRR